MIVKSRFYILFTIVSLIGLLFPYCANIKVDINNIDAPDGNWIVLANGSWNSWNWGTELYDNDGDNIFERMVPMDMYIPLPVSLITGVAGEWFQMPPTTVLVILYLMTNG